MPTVRTFLCAAACATLMACAAPAPPPAASATPPPPPDTPDGIYRGTSTRFQADSRTCPHPGLVTLYVQNGQFSYRWNFGTWVDSSLDPDGAAHGQAIGITLLGKRSGKTLEGDVTNGVCGLHFTTTRRDS
jgi:hypothetical protein